MRHIAIALLLLCAPQLTRAADVTSLEPRSPQSPPSSSVVPYTPAVSAHWPIGPTMVNSALDVLAAYITTTTAIANARAAPLYWSVGNTGSIATNNYLGRLGDISATATLVAPAVVPCNGTIGDLRAQRTANATATGTIQIFKATGGGVPTYASTGLTCAITVGTASCSQVLSTAVSAGDLLIVRAVGSAWSVGAGTISVKLLCS